MQVNDWVRRNSIYVAAEGEDFICISPFKDYLIIAINGDKITLKVDLSEKNIYMNMVLNTSISRFKEKTFWIGNFHKVDSKEEKIIKWDKKYLSLAQFIANWSKDQSTKVGAVIFDDKFRVVSMGYNGFPQNMYDDPELIKDRNTKLSITVHAEINAIIFAQRDLTGCSLVTWPFSPCSNCASAIIQSGIKRVVSLESDNPRWKESFEFSKKMFQEAGIEFKLYENLDI